MRGSFAYAAPAALFALVAAVPLIAEAQETPDIKIQLQVLDEPDADPTLESSWHDISQTEKLEFFNLANCTCPEGDNVRLQFAKGAITDYTGTVEIWSGARCDDVTDVAERDARCELFGSFDASEFSLGREINVTTQASVLMYPNSAGDCGEDEKTTNVFALIDRDGDGQYDSVSISDDYAVDTEPPPEVSKLEVSGAEDAVALSWELPTGRVEDIKYFQVLCAVDGEPVFATPPSGPEYELACGVDVNPPMADAGPMMPDASLPDAGAPADAGADATPAVDAGSQADAAPPPPTGALEGLDPRFICSGRLANNATKVRVELPSDFTLNANQMVEVKLVIIDDHLNPLGMPSGFARPAPVQDFWESYDDQGGGAIGGFCFVATAAYGDYDHPFVRVLRDFRDGTLAKFGAGRAFIGWYYRHSPPLARFIERHPGARLTAQVLLWPVVLAAGAWEYTGAGDKLVLLALLVLWRVRRRQRRKGGAPSPGALRAAAAGLAALAILLAGVRGASAQVVYDEEGLDLEAPPLKQSAWTYELRVGPYHPQVDSEPGLPDPGPYDRTFGGGDTVMVQMELDRYFAYPFGQLGVGFGLGYLQETDLAWAQQANGMPDFSMRSESDETSFHLLPLYATAVYRFTKIADETVFPIVLYGKLGLSYYIWWVTKGNGDVTESGDNGKARGGTLGWQGALGLSFRVDAIDPQAARNLEVEMGVEHVGLFIELSMADVSGLGQDNRLHVGDTTYFGGVNFEF